MTDETALWEGLETKDEKTFKLIYESLYPTLFRYGRKITRNDDIVRDAIQELFLSLYERKSAFNKQQPLRFFLLSALRNKLIDCLKKQPNYSLTFVESPVADENEASSLDTMIMIEDEQNNVQQMKHAFALLSERQREALHLRYYEELSPQQIAELMNMNYQSVLNLIQRGLQRLSGLIKLTSIVAMGTLYSLFLPISRRWLKKL